MDIVDLDKVLDEFEQNEDKDNADKLAALQEKTSTTDLLTSNNSKQSSASLFPSNNSEHLSIFPTDNGEHSSESIFPSTSSAINGVKKPVANLPNYDFQFKPLEKLEMVDAEFAAFLKTSTNIDSEEITESKTNDISAGNNSLVLENISLNIEKKQFPDKKNFSPAEEIGTKEINKVHNDLILLSTTTKLEKINNDERCQMNSTHENTNKISNNDDSNTCVEEMKILSDKLSTAVGFTDMLLSDADIEDHFKEAEMELGTDLEETDNLTLNVEDCDRKSDLVQVEDSSSGEEYFSPLGEVKTPLKDVEIASEFSSPELYPCDRSDAGLHRAKENKKTNEIFKVFKTLEVVNENIQEEVGEILDAATEDNEENGALEDKKIQDDAINEKMALYSKASDTRFLKEQINQEIKNQIIAEDVLVNENFRQEEGLNDVGASGHSGHGKRQRPTSLMLSGIETSLGVADEPSTDFPTPANPSANYLEESTLHDGSGITMGEEMDCNNVWKEDETVTTPISSNTPDWHGAEDFQLGLMAPFWIPDSEASSCMHCNIKFTVLKRRHHCRACGQVLCSQCCGAKAKLQFMDNREARVCNQCYLLLKKAESPCAGSLTAAPLMSPCLQPISRPNPNNPNEYCSTISPLQQAKANPQTSLPTVMVPVGVLKREGFKSKGAGEPKQVMFSDGIRPGGDLTELDELEEPKPLYRRPGRIQKKIERNVDCSLTESSPVHLTRLPELPLHLSNYVPEEEMRYPPILYCDENGIESVDTNPDPNFIFQKLNDPNEPPIKFAINKNLFVFVKIVTLHCCLGRSCWSFTTKGMCNVAQEEMVIVLECLPDEKEVAKDIFFHFSSVYDDASHGIVLSHLSCSIFNHSFLSSRDHGGFLYIKPTTQCLKQLPIPDSSFLVGILLQKWEMPWAKVFPLRLMLRLGAEFSYYPCPILSCRFRKPVFYEIGHTIMNILADFRNYQYTLPNIRGMKIHMEDKKTRIKFPRNRYDDVMRALNNSNDHVLALGSNFSMEADSHLICIQNEDGSYQTQSANSEKTIGASFVVFSGALKSSSGLMAKLSVVEDGIMVQIPPDKMAELRQALRDMHELTINCGPVDAETHEEAVFIQWVEDDKEFNVGVKSPIDNMPMDGVQSIRIHGGTDYVGERWLIRWTEVFLIQTDELINSRRSEPVNISRLSEKLAQAFCMALTTHLESLKIANMTKLGLRATIDTENVGYDVGSLGDKLPAMYMNDLDSNLIPVIHRAVSTTQEGPVTLELIFHVLEQ